MLLDGWSAAILLKEVFTSYESLRSGVSNSITPRRAYRDYCMWLKQQDMEKAKAILADELEGFYHGDAELCTNLADFVTSSF